MSMLGCTRTMRACDRAPVKSKEGFSGPFWCYAGVRQGCALSPDLFGIFTDESKRSSETKRTRSSFFARESASQGSHAGQEDPIADVCRWCHGGLNSPGRFAQPGRCSTYCLHCASRSSTVNVAKISNHGGLEGAQLKV